MDPYNVANLSNDWTIFEAIRIDDYDGKIEVFVNIVAYRVQRTINHFD